MFFFKKSSNDIIDSSTIKTVACVAFLFFENVITVKVIKYCIKISLAVIENCGLPFYLFKTSDPPAASHV